MTQQELNEIIQKQYERMGLSSEVSSRLVNSEVEPASPAMQIKEETATTNLKPLEKLSKTASFSFEPPKERRETIILRTKAKKEDLLDALTNALSDFKDLIDVNTLQEGKAGALMFKNHNGDYFTLKLTLNKSKPADFIE